MLNTAHTIVDDIKPSANSLIDDDDLPVLKSRFGNDYHDAFRFVPAPITRNIVIKMLYRRMHDAGI